MKKHRAIILTLFVLCCLGLTAIISFFIKNVAPLKVFDLPTRVHREYAIKDNKDLVVDLFDCGKDCISQTVVFIRRTNEDGSRVKERELFNCSDVLDITFSAVIDRPYVEITSLHKRPESTCPHAVGDQFAL